MRHIGTKPMPSEDGVLTHRGMLHHQATTAYSFWRPSFWEFVRLAIGRPIRLGVFGAGHISIDTEE